MAIIPSNFNSLALTTPLPSNFIDWFPIWSINKKNLKWTANIPKKYLPLDTIAIGEDIAYNLMIAPDTFYNRERAIGSIGIVQVAQAIKDVAGNIGVETGFITLSRKKSWGQFGQDTYNYSSSPRFGYQIGSFKQQSYFRVRSMGTNPFGEGWTSFDTIPNIEYVTNNRLKKLYLSHGKILSIRKELGNIFYVSLCAFSQKPDMNFRPSGTLSVWSLDETDETKPKYNKFDFDLSKTQIADNGELIFDKATLPDIEKIYANDFFSIDKPWILEDYSLLFEYGLNKNNGFFETNEQKHKALYESGNMIVRGVWVQLPKKLTYTDKSEETVSLWTLYTDLDASMFVLPTTPEDEKYYGENSDIGGTLQEGIKLLKQDFKDGKITVARVVVFGANSALQNFYPPSLVGEFVKTGDNYFEITEHPRTETIGVQINSTNAVVNFTDVGLGGKTIDVFQQKFWFINELYYNYPYSIGLWQTEKFITSLATNDYTNEIVVDNIGEGGDQVGIRTTTSTLTWTDSNGGTQTETKTIIISSIEISKQDKETSTSKTKTTNIFLNAYDVLSTFVDKEENTITNCTLLTERFYKPYKSFQFEADDILTYGFYKKFTTWYFWNASKQKAYKILDATFNKDKSWTAEKPLLEIKLTIEGDLTSEINIGSTEGYIFTDLPHQTYSGNHGEMTLSLNMAPSSTADPDGKWYSYMYGNYYSGTYVLPEPASQFLLTSFSYGDTVISGGRDIPNVLASVIYSKNDFIGGCVQKIGENRRDYLFFNASAKNRWLINRQGSCAWNKENQRKLVIMKEPDEYKSTDIATLQKANKAVVKMVYTVTNSGDAYWFVSPKSKTKPPSPYESYYVSVGADAVSDLTTFYGLDDMPSEGVYFPFEFFSFEKKTENATIKQVVIDTYFTSSSLNSGECIDKIYGADISAKNKLISAINGKSVSMGTLSFAVDKILCVDENMILKNVDYVWAYSTMTSSIFLFYNMSPSDFWSDDAGGSIEHLNPPRPSVFVLRSDNSGDDFHSPSVLEKDKGGGSSPLMILYDFDLRCAAINQEETTCYLFGFTYTRGLGPLDKDSKTGQPVNFTKNCFLAMYCFNLNDVFAKESNTYQFANKDGTTIWVGRIPSLKIPDSKDITANATNEYGELKNLFGKQLYECGSEGGIDDYNIPKDSESSQYLVSILNQNNATFEPEQISASINSSGVLTLFMNVNKFKYKDKDDKDGTVSGIISLSSKNGGITWVADADSNKIPIIYSDNTSQKNPYLLGSLLFVMDSSQNKLIVKNLEKKLVQRTNVVASNVLPQNIYAVMKETGEIYVYYNNMNGNISASCSRDNGITWQGLNNW